VTQIDFIGGGANLSPKPSKPIANQRPTVAKRKPSFAFASASCAASLLPVSQTAPFRRLANGLLR
jgi:hypothetical protein